jgi:hypothetical protein
MRTEVLEDMVAEAMQIEVQTRIRVVPPRTEETEVAVEDVRPFSGREQRLSQSVEAAVLDMTKVEGLHGLEPQQLALAMVVVVALLREGVHMVREVTQRHSAWARQVHNFKVETGTTTAAAVVVDGGVVVAAQQRAGWVETVAAGHHTLRIWQVPLDRTAQEERHLELHCPIT